MFILLQVDGESLQVGSAGSSDDTISDQDLSAHGDANDLLSIAHADCGTLEVS